MIRQFDPHTASEEMWDAAHRHRMAMLAESWPDDPPMSREQLVARARNIPPFVEPYLWGVTDEGEREVWATAGVFLLLTGDNAHVAQFELDVLPERRQQGLGRSLLAEIAKVTREKGRSLLVAKTSDRSPGSREFMERIGAHLGLEEHLNQLDLESLDRTWFADWHAQAQARTTDAVLESWEGSYAEANLAEAAEMMGMANAIPRGGIQMDDMHFTPEMMRQMDAARQAEGSERLTILVRDPASRKVAGFTQVFWHLQKPAVLNQGITAVWPQYRNRGYGRRLKADMLARVLAEMPHIRYVRTENADSNAPMLKINEELGFRPYRAEYLWQVPLERVEAYLAERA